MTDTETILHNLRDSNTEASAAMARIVEERDAYRASLEAATKRVEELEAELENDTVSWEQFFRLNDDRIGLSLALIRMAKWRDLCINSKAKAEARVKALETALEPDAIALLDSYRASILKEAADRAVAWYRSGQLIPAHTNSLAVRELHAAIEGDKA